MLATYLPAPALSSFIAKTCCTRAVPLEAGFAEDAVQPFVLGLRFDGLRAGNDDRPYTVGYPLALHDPCGLAQVLDPPLVHEPMKTMSTGWPAIGWPWRRPMYSSALNRLRRSADRPARQPSGCGR